MGRVQGKVAIVTGGACGLGRVDCLFLSKEGATVAVVDIDDAAGLETVAEIRENGGTAEYWRMDVSNEKEVEMTFAEISERFGKIDVLVNNAGVQGIQKATHEFTEQEWDRVMDIDVKGVFFCTKHVIPYMKKAGQGSIINISSICGIVGHPNDSVYHAAKAAVRLMSKVDALCYGPDRIRVNSVHPSMIRTPMSDSFAEKFPGGREAYEKRTVSLLPIGYMGEPEDVAYGVLYLASDESKFVTGTEFIIDGGYLAK